MHPSATPWSRNARAKPPLRAMTALLVACITLVAATSLALLRAIHERATRRLAATSFLAQGRAWATALSAACGPDAPADDEALWRRLDWLFEAASGADPAWESLSVERDGVTVFERQASLRAAPEWGAPGAAPVADDVAAEHVVQDVGRQSVPVLMFTRRVVDRLGRAVTLQLGLRRDLLAPDERLAAGAVRTMYRIALVTQLATFLALLGVVLWLMERERRREARRREEEHLAFAGVLANGVVHDFRNPMSAIRLDAQLLEREARKPDAHPARLSELAGRMRTTLDRLENVFQEFFFLSQPGRGAPEVIDLAACLRECAAILQARFEDAGVSVAFPAPADPLPVLAVAAPLRRALLNVLANAASFAPRGSAVELHATRHTSEVVLDVLDRGPGIAAAERERVFEMFVSSRPGGTGLGLFLARTALAQCGGRIAARERAGGGACIRLWLPAAPREDKRA